MVHPDTELRRISPRIGFGVVATARIPRGTITWIRDRLDQTFTPQQVAALPEPYQRILDKYAFVDATGSSILCWDHSRFFNHSCNPNCLSAGYDFELAVRDIEPGEELTDDYATLNLTEPFECLCGTAACRQRILPDDMERLADHWDRVVAGAFFQIESVDQPLWSLFEEKAEVETALRDPSSLRSIRTHYLPRR
ncbi:MAG TPA: SET domain-containing protein [Candidatus Limnocylindrales bacterium]|nr:SET domain-containing protein [Candidatus Limnocylindrales bacterium]